MKLQQLILNVGASLNILYDNNPGICRGYTMKWVEAYLMGLQHVHFFQLRLTRNIAEDRAKIEKIKHLNDQLATGKLKLRFLSNDEVILYELSLFYLGLDMYHFPAKYFKPALNQHNIQKISLKASPKTGPHGGLNSIFTEVNLQSKSEIQIYLQNLARICEQLRVPFNALAFVLASHNHSIGLAYRGNNLWQYTNIVEDESVIGEKIVSTAQIGHVVFNALASYLEERELTYLDDFLSSELTKSKLNEGDKAHPGLHFLKFRYEGSVFFLLYVSKESSWFFWDEIAQTKDINDHKFLSTQQMAKEVFIRAIKPSNYLAYSLEVVALTHFAYRLRLKQYFQSFMPVSQKITKAQIESGEINHYAFICSRMGAIDKIHELIAQNVKLDTLRSHRNMSLMHAAAENNHIDVIRLLSQQGIDIDAQDDDGLTAAYFAVQNGYEDIITLLAQLGADLTIGNKLGQSLIDVANIQEFHEIARILRNYRKEKMSECKATLFPRGADVSTTYKEHQPMLLSLSYDA